jgi:hypothetical protein
MEKRKRPSSLPQEAGAGDGTPPPYFRDPKDGPLPPRRKRELPPADDMTPPRGSPGMPKYAKGGYTRAADGCVQRGKTKGRMI